MKIGVYIAGRNCDSWARPCVESLQKQAHQDWRACVVDDCSEDRTTETAFETAGGDPRIRILRNNIRKHSCLSKLRAIGNLMDCDVLVGLDLDDWLREDALSRIDEAHRNGAMVTYGSFQFQTGKPGPTPVQPTAETWARRRPPNGGDGWFLTAANTFRANLVPLVPLEYFQWSDGRGYYETGFDGAIMLAMTDLVGMEATRCLENRFYFYRRNLKTNVSATRSIEYRAAVLADQCAKKPLDRVYS